MRSSRTFHLSTVLVAIAAFVLLLLAGSGFAQTPPGTAPACRTPEVEAEIQKLTDEISRFQQTYNSLQQEYSQAAQQVREMVSSGRYRGATPGSPAFDELSAASSKADALFARFVAMSNALHADETKLAALKALPACGQQPVAAPPQPQPNAMTPPPPEAPKPVNPTCRSPDVEARIAWLRAEIDYLTRGIEIYQRALEEYETRYTDIALKNLNDPRLKNIQEDVNDEKRAIKQGERYRAAFQKELDKLLGLPPCGQPGAGVTPPSSQTPTLPKAAIETPPPPVIRPQDQVMQLPGVPLVTDRLYAGGKAGWTHLGTLDAVTHFEDGGTATDRDRHDEGFDVGGRLGLKQGPWRFEGEFNYRRNGLSEMISTSDPKASGSTQAFTFLGNAIYDFDVSSFGWATPHVGAGIGLAHLQAKQKIAGITLLNSSDTQFAYQAIAGLRVPLAPNWAFDLDYRYLASADPTYRDTVGNRVTSSYQTHNVIASFTYSFAPPPPLPALFPTIPPPR